MPGLGHTLVDAHGLVGRYCGAPFGLFRAQRAFPRYDRQASATWPSSLLDGPARRRLPPTGADDESGSTAAPRPVRCRAFPGPVRQAAASTNRDGNPTDAKRGACTYQPFTALSEAKAQTRELGLLDDHSRHRHRQSTATRTARAVAGGDRAKNDPFFRRHDDIPHRFPILADAVAIHVRKSSKKRFAPVVGP